MSSETSKSAALSVGGLAAILASPCCLGPLALIAIGFSGAWIGNLAKLEPYRPIFIGIASIAMFSSWRAIYRPARQCNPGDVYALPQTKRLYKVLFWIVVFLVLIALSFPYLAPWFIEGAVHEPKI